MSDEVVDDCLVALKFICDWFVTSEMLEKFHDALFANDDILFFNEDFNKVTFIANKRHNLAVDLDKLIFMKIKILMKMILILLFVRILAWHSKFEKQKALKEI